MNANIINATPNFIIFPSRRRGAAAAQIKMTEGLIGDKVSQVEIDYWITHHEYGRRAHAFTCWMADEISKLPCITRDAADITTLGSMLFAKWVGVSLHAGFRDNLFCTLFDLCMNPSQLDGLIAAVPTGFVAYWRID